MELKRVHCEMARPRVASSRAPAMPLRFQPEFIIGMKIKAGGPLRTKG